MTVKSNVTLVAKWSIVVFHYYTCELKLVLVTIKLLVFYVACKTRRAFYFGT